MIRSLDEPLGKSSEESWELGPFVFLVGDDGKSALLAQAFIRVSSDTEYKSLLEKSFPFDTTLRQVKKEMADWAIKQYEKWISEAADQ